MFEHPDTPVIPKRHFIKRLLGTFGVGFFLILLSLLIGAVGYHYTENMSWIDALLNASMIAGGMGQVDTLKTIGGKLFASFYAIYSGLFLIGVAGFLLAPIFHRIIHKFHQSKNCR